MRNSFSTGLLIVLFSTSLFLPAQDSNPQFGVTLGYGLINVSVEGETTSESGFFLGGTLDFVLDEKWSLAPKILYANYSDVGFLHVPLYAQYSVMDGLGIQAGPQLSVVLDDPFNTAHELGVDLGFGLNYDFSDKVYINARYALELTDRNNNDFLDESYGFNTFMIGIGYRF